MRPDRKQPLSLRIRNLWDERGILILGATVRYLLLSFIAFIFLYPLINMFSTSVKNIYDQVNPLVLWFPEEFHWENYRRAWISLGGTETYLLSLRNIGLIAVIQTISSALIGYGMAKFDYWWSKLALILMVVVFVLPQELFLLPQYVMFSRYNLVDTIWPVVLLSAFGHGMKNPIYILIFYSFFSIQPKMLDEAAYVDGAGYFRTFFRINIPMAIPAFIVSFILSFVWNWNDTTINGRFWGGKVTTVQLKLEQFGQLYNQNFPYDMSRSSPLEYMNPGIELAGVMLAILPLILAYFLLQRFIVEGVDQSGITGE